MDRRGTDDVSGRQMIHQSEKIRQVRLGHPLLVDRQDVAAAIGREQEIAVLDAFGNAFAGDGLADVVQRNEGFQVAVRDFSVDGHRRSGRSSWEMIHALSACGSLKCTSSSITEKFSTVTSYRARQASSTSWTRISGAEAPAVRPRRRTP